MMMQTQAQSMGYAPIGARPSLWQRFIATHNDFGIAVVRIVLGVVMLPHGLQKTLGWFGGYGFTATLNALPGGKPLAFLVIMAESVGALLLILGFAGRFMAFSIACVMTGAILMVHQQNGFFMNWSNHQPGEGFEYHLLAIGMALAVMIRGSGAGSIDHAMQRSPRL